LYGSQSLGCWVSPLPLTWPCFGWQCLTLRSTDNITNGCNPCRLPWCRPSIYVYSHCVHLARCVQSCSTFTRLYDHLLTRMPRQNLRLDSWMEQEACGFTSFTKGQLSNIYHHFGLAARTTQNDGAILVPSGADHSRSHTYSDRTVCARAASRLSPLDQYLYLP